MLTLLQFDWPVLAAALLIGIATGRWIFRGRRARTQEPNPESVKDESLP